MQGQAHPRSRGENHPLIAVMATPEGLIPAHAGKTCSRASSASAFAAHPRSRGENPSDASSLEDVVGSSPLTRGKHGAVAVGAAAGRLIPAHAGKTDVSAAPTSWASAHPRSRGENVLAIKRAAFHRGSSPLTRGKRPLGRRSHRRPRLIPAHAGKTSPSNPTGTGAWAHPRSRGENQVAVLAIRRAAGSSPLTRGKPVKRLQSRLADRLIPAHAGKTSSGPACRI